MDKIIYSRISGERDISLQVMTQIIKTDDGKRVIKSALHPSGSGHLKRIIHNGESLRNVFKDKADICKAELSDDHIEFEFIEGGSLDSRLEQACMTNDENEIIRVLSSYYELIKVMDSNTAFTMTEDYQSVFGDADPGSVPAGNVVDIDLLPSNVIIRNGRYCIIDYEWVFEFPVPLDYVFWKGVFSSVSFSMLPEELRERVFDRFGLTKEVTDRCLQMEINFQKYVSGKTYTARDFISNNPTQLIHPSNLKAEVEDLRVRLFDTVKIADERTAELNECKAKLVDAENTIGLQAYELKTIKESKAWRILKWLRIVK